MLEINLLPPQYQKKTKIINYLNRALPPLFLFLLATVVLNLILGFLIVQRKIALNRVNSSWQRKEPFFREINSLKEDFSKLSQEYKNLSSILEQNYSFSELMYLIYESLPLNIWFEELSFRNGCLSLRGTALDYQKDASLSLKDFVDNLKNKDKITKIFPRVEILSQEMRRIKQKRVLYFELVLRR